MPILLETQVDRTAKTPIPARRARVGGLCGFQDTVERVPTGSLKTGRCADVRERWQKTSEQDEMAAGKAACSKCRNTPERAKSRDFGRRGEKAGERPDAFLRPVVHCYPQCGQFRGMKMALFCGCQKWNGAVIDQKPRSTSKIKDNFDAITILGGFEHENRRKKPPHRLDGRCGLAKGAGAV